MSRQRLFGSSFLVALLSLTAAAEAQLALEECGGGPAEIRVGVLYIGTPTGERHLRGIEEAESGHRIEERVCLVGYPYVNENKGLDILLRLVRNEEVDLVLGPTESGVFVRAFARQEELAPHQVPVISGLVTANVANRPTGWFFRTNLDVTRRVQAIYDFLNKSWVRSVAVLYADTEFGRRAEVAFSKELTSSLADQYLALLYETPPDPRRQLREILDRRPEAVGFFGEREDIAQIYRTLAVMNGRPTPYRPVFFTVLDAREVAEAVKDIYFVSVTPQVDGDGYDDVKALGHDTARLVLNELAKLPSAPMTGELRRRFRDQFATLLGRSRRQAGTRTSIRFTNFENSSRPQVFHLSGEEAARVNLSATYGLGENLERRLELIRNAYGWWPALAVALALIVTVGISWTELGRWFQGGDKKIYHCWIFYAWSGGHFLVVLVLYVVLAETGRIRYDSLLVVLVLALAPTAFLRTTLFQTPQGKAIGLDGLYEKLTHWADRQIMQARYSALQARINLIAYSNSLNAMRQNLLDIYRNHPSPQAGARLIQELERDLQEEKHYFERRRICARRLLRQWDWERLVADGWVPCAWHKTAVPDSEEPGSSTALLRPVNPQRLVRRAARRSARSEEKITTVQEEIDREMERIRKRNPKRHQELEDFLESELDDAIAIEGELNVKMRFVFVLKGFDVEELEDLGILAREDLDEELAAVRSERERSGGPLRAVRRWLGGRAGAEDRNGTVA